jgi:hypothetical protein
VISFRRCSQRTLPRQEFEHLTLCSSKVQQLRRSAPRTRPREKLPPNSPLTLDLRTPESGRAEAEASSWAEIARDIHRVILGDMVGRIAESPGSNAGGQGVMYALENRYLGPNGRTCLRLWTADGPW